MSTSDLIKRAGRGLKSAKLRTLLTALAISVGGFTLALTLAASNGVRNYTDELVENNFDPAELTAARDPEITSTGGGPSGAPQEYDPAIGDVQFGDGGSVQIKQVTQADIEILEQYEQIEQVRPFFTIPMQYVTREGQKEYTGSLQPYSPGQKPELVAGELPVDNDLEAGSIILPEAYLELLGFINADEAIGKEIDISISKEFSFDAIEDLLSGGIDSEDFTDLSVDTVAPQEKRFTFKVSGVSVRPATSFVFGVLPLEISSEDARELYVFANEGSSNFEKYIYATVKVENGEDNAVLQSVSEQLEADGFYVLTTDDIQETLNQFVDILTGMVFALGAVTLIASVFGIVNTQYISVLERTREIGLMKALGMSKKNISLLFIYEAAWIGFIGGLLGIIGAFIIGTILNPFINDALNIEDNLIVFDFLQLLGLLFALMLIGVLAGLLPARKAAKLDPVEALRTE